MPRPRKYKKVCSVPENNLFGVLNGTISDDRTIIMTVEEYETIRLIDLESLTQEECAKRMNVSRATIQKMYNDARSKLADTLVSSFILKIEGGDYKLYEESDLIYGCRRCRRRRCGQNISDGRQY